MCNSAQTSAAKCGLPAVFDLTEQIHTILSFINKNMSLASVLGTHGVVKQT